MPEGRRGMQNKQYQNLRINTKMIECIVSEPAVEKKRKVKSLTNAAKEIKE